MICSPRGLRLAPLLLILSGCNRMGNGFTTIADIRANPEKFAEQEIRIHGRVVDVLKVPFVATKLYSLRDGSGEINIRTDREAPLAGAQVRVKGVIDTVAVFGGQTLGLHLREIQRW